MRLLAGREVGTWEATRMTKWNWGPMWAHLYKQASDKFEHFGRTHSRRDGL